VSFRPSISLLVLLLLFASIIVPFIVSMLVDFVELLDTHMSKIEQTIEEKEIFQPRTDLANTSEYQRYNETTSVYRNAIVFFVNILTNKYVIATLLGLAILYSVVETYTTLTRYTRLSILSITTQSITHSHI